LPSLACLHFGLIRLFNRFIHMHRLRHFLPMFQPL
jgi:hypothetical protein